MTDTTPPNRDLRSKVASDPGSSNDHSEPGTGVPTDEVGGSPGPFLFFLFSYHSMLTMSFQGVDHDVEQYTGFTVGVPTHHAGTFNAAVNQAPQPVLVNVSSPPLLVRSVFVLNHVLLDPSIRLVHEGKPYECSVEIVRLTSVCSKLHKFKLTVTPSCNSHWSVCSQTHSSRTPATHSFSMWISLSPGVTWFISSVYFSFWSLLPTS